MSHILHDYCCCPMLRHAMGLRFFEQNSNRPRSWSNGSALVLLHAPVDPAVRTDIWVKRCVLKTIWHLEADVVSQDVQLIAQQSTKLERQLNLTNCEAILQNCDDKGNNPLCYTAHTRHYKEEATLVGSPLMPGRDVDISVELWGGWPGTSSLE